MSTLTPSEIKALEQTRQRLYQLTNSLASLQHSLQSSDPFPSWASLQSYASIISQNLLSTSQHLSDQHELFSSSVVYPLPTFPGLTEENLLGQLLRKKLEPHVEDWVDEGRNIAGAAAAAAAAAHESVDPVDDKDLAELWDWAGRAANDEARKREWGGNFTLEERDVGVTNVVTGLRRKLDDDEDDEDEEDDSGADDDEDMGDAQAGKKDGKKDAEGSAGMGSQRKTNIPARPPLRMDDLLRFMSVGAEPGSTASLVASAQIRR